MHRYLAGPISALFLFSIAATSSCRRGSDLPRWDPSGFEARQNPLLLPLDGMTDVTKLCTPAPCADGAPLRAAINDALWVQNKRALYFPPGEHSLPTHILVPSNTTIGGLGPSSIVRRGGTAQGAIFILDGVSHVTIANLTLWNNKAGEAAGSSDAIVITSGAGLVSTNIRIVNNLFISNDPGHSNASAATGIGADGSAKLSESWITNNYTKSARLLRFTSMSLRNLFITDNKVDGAPADGLSIFSNSGPVRFENILITNNNIAGFTANGIRVGGADGAGIEGVMQNIKIANNTLIATGSGTSRGIWMLELAVGGAESRPNRNIAITGNTISRREDQTTSLTGIALDRGTSNASWSESVLIAGNTIRDETGGTISRGIRASYIRHSIISDNTIGTPDYGIVVDQHEGLLIKGNNISGNSPTSPTLGIFLGYGSDTMLTGNVVTGRTGYAGGGYAALRLGVVSLAAPKSTFSNILVRGNRFVGLETTPPTTCAIQQDAANYDVRLYNNDLTHNNVFCGNTGAKAFVDNMVDSPSDDARLARHITKSQSMTFSLNGDVTDDAPMTGNVMGARPGDAITIAVNSPPVGVSFQAYVATDNQVTVRATRSVGPITEDVVVGVRVSILQYAN